MPNWKVQLIADDEALTALALENKTPEVYITRDGVDCFLESTDFFMSTDHLEVKEKAAEIVQALLKSKSAPPGLGIGAIYRVHYDNSKTVYRE